jgi:hypothetical protein
MNWRRLQMITESLLTASLEIHNHWPLAANMNITLYTFETEDSFNVFKERYLNHDDVEVIRPLKFPCVGILQCTEGSPQFRPGRFVPQNGRFVEQTPPPGSKLVNFVYLDHFGIETNNAHEYLEQYL